MEFSTAVHLIEKGIYKSDTPQRWADLGAGDGLFTRALGSVLPENSSILAVDQNVSSLKFIRWNLKSVSLQTQVDNFISMNWAENLDGILMANALHYVSDQVAFSLRLKTKLSPLGRLIVVEYERRQSNAWVPYPVDFKKLQELGEKAGFSSIVKLEETPSIFDGATIYSAVLSM